MPAGQPQAHDLDGGGGGGASHSNNHHAYSAPPAALPPEVVPAYPPPESVDDESWVWTQIKAEARRDAEAEPALASFLYATVLSHPSLPRSLSFHLANKLCSSTLLSTLLYDIFLASLTAHPSLRAAVVADLLAARARDPACVGFSHCLLNFKGFLAIQAHRVAHVLWAQNRRPLALALQSRVADVFAVDIHPAAVVGKAILLDHATGVVIGETAVVGDNVSILHHVTLGGTGKAVGDRHPKIGDGVLIGAGATILGNVMIGAGAKIGAGSVVLIDVPARSTAVGNPARLLGRVMARRRRTCQESPWITPPSYGSGRTTPSERAIVQGLLLTLCITSREVLLVVLVFFPLRLRMNMNCSVVCTVECVFTCFFS